MMSIAPSSHRVDHAPDVLVLARGARFEGKILLGRKERGIRFDLTHRGRLRVIAPHRNTSQNLHRALGKRPDVEPWELEFCRGVVRESHVFVGPTAPARRFAAASTQRRFRWMRLCGTSMWAAGGYRD
jgi:hypothetical protein